MSKVQTFIVDLNEVEEAVERWHGHSVILNAIAWKVAEALGDIPPGAERHEGNVLEDVDRLIKLYKECVQARGIQWAQGYE